MSAWECFQDASYYDMWCVRPVGERVFGNGFHLLRGEEAAGLRDLLNARTTDEHPTAEDYRNRAQRAEQALAERDAEVARYLHALRNILTPSMQRDPEYAGMTLGDIAQDALGDNDAVKTGDEK